MIVPFRLLGALVAVLLVAGCADGLVYGERTAFNLASVRLNDDPSQPVSIKVGFDRDVVLVAPPIGGKVVEKDGDDGQHTTARGEAVSQFSTFTIKSTAPFLNPTAPADLLQVQTRFASGHAARAIAGEPAVVAAVMGLRVPSAREQVGNALSELDADQRQAVCRLAQKDFDDLTEQEIEEAGNLTGFHSLYDGALHADVRSACEGQS